MAEMLMPSLAMAEPATSAFDIPDTPPTDDSCSVVRALVRTPRWRRARDDELVLATLVVPFSETDDLVDAGSACEMFSSTLSSEPETCATLWVTY